MRYWSHGLVSDDALYKSAQTADRDGGVLFRAPLRTDEWWPSLRRSPADTLTIELDWLQFVNASSAFIC